MASPTKWGSARSRKPVRKLGMAEVIELLDSSSEDVVIVEETRRVRRRVEAGAGPSASAASDGPVIVTEAELRVYDDQIEFYQREAESATQQQKKPISATEQAKLVRSMVRCMLFRQHKEPDRPVSQSVLTGLCTAYKKANVSGMIIAHAQAKLATAFGLELKEIRVPSANARAADEAGSKFYVLRSLLPPALRTALVQDPKQHAMQGFEMMVLAIVHMNGEKITEGDLHRLLEDVGVRKPTPNDGADLPMFGKVEERLKQMVSNKYLKSQKKQGPDGEVVEYEIGKNAWDEIGGEPALQAFIDRVFSEEGLGD